MPLPGHPYGPGLPSLKPHLRGWPLTRSSRTKYRRKHTDMPSSRFQRSRDTQSLYAPTSTSSSSSSARTTPTTSSFPPPARLRPPVPRSRPSSLSNLELGASLLDSKRRSAYASLAFSADLLDSTRRQSRNSMIRNMESTAEKLESTRRRLGDGIKRSAERVRIKSWAREEENTDGDDDDDGLTFRCRGEPRWMASEYGDREEKENLQTSNEGLEERSREGVPATPQYPRRRSSLGWVVIGLLAQKGELRESVIASSSHTPRLEYNKALPAFPEEGLGVKERGSYSHST